MQIHLGSTVSIPTHDLPMRHINGEISLTILRGQDYELDATATKNVTILDKAVLPGISISKQNSAPIDEGEEAVFMLSADPNPTSTIMVSVEVEYAQGSMRSFLNPSDIKIHRVPVH